MSFLHVEEGGRRLRLAIARTARGVWVGWPGGARLFTPERSDAAAGPSAPAEVRAPMTGRVVKVAVAPGATVQADDVLVILQAMKMEYRLTSPRAGVVRAVSCAEGQMVDLGATLVSLAPQDAPEDRGGAADPDGRPGATGGGRGAGAPAAE